MLGLKVNLKVNQMKPFRQIDADVFNEKPHLTFTEWTFFSVVNI